MSTDVEGLPVLDEEDVLDERDLVDGEFVSVSIASYKGEPQMFVSLTAAGVDRVSNDGWFLPADAALLRGLSRDLAAAADALDGG